MSHISFKSLANFSILVLIPNIFAETHVVLDQLDKKVIKFVADSPFTMRQPHSLVDLLNQIKWVEELSKSYSVIKRQQMSIEKRYDDDDPEIEKKIRSNDPNCVESQPLDLQTENFVNTYTSDLAPNFILHADLTHSGVPSTLETFQLDYLKKLFLTQAVSEEHREPFCESYIFSAWANEIASEADNLSNYPEPGFTKLDESQLSNIAAFLTDRLEEAVTKRVDNCLECWLALADALVLDGNFQAAIVAYEEAHKKNPEYVIVTKKMALLRCVLRVFEEMENQHTHLLDTIQDVNEYKEKLKQLKVLEALIESNRASPEVRLQAKLAYQYYTLGPMPHLNCRGLSTPAENGKQELSRLYCGVDNWKLYNESLINRYQQQLLSAKNKKTDSKITQVELFEAEKLKYEKRTNAEMEKYLRKIAPFVAMHADEPQNSARYPLNNDRRLSAKFFEPTWPSLEECRRKYVASDDPQLPPFFLSPENKGMIVSDFLTKYLALNSAAEISPLPWQTPNCTSESEEADASVDRLFEREIIQKILHNSSKYSHSKGRGLKSALVGLVEPHRESASSKVPIGDLGNRIFLLIKYNIGPRWMSMNLAALFYRYLGMTSQALVCLKGALKTNLYKDVAYVQLAQIIYSESPTNNSDDAERVLGLALKEGPYEPLIYFLLAFIHKSKGNDRIAEKMLLQSLDIDPTLEMASDLLLGLRCKKKMKSTLLVKSIQNAIPRVCCWPNEENVYCFKNGASCSSRLKSACPKEYCFKLELSSQNKLEFIYYRCNAIYTGKSYKPPSFAYLIAPLLKTAAELRHIEMRNLVKKVYKQSPEEDESNESYPVFPLDYSDELAVYAHQQKASQQNLDTLHKYSAFIAKDVEEEEKKHSSDYQLPDLPGVHLPPDTSLPPIESVVERQDILKYDAISFAKSLPVPNSALVEEGSAKMTPMTLQELTTYCSTLKENSKLSEKQPPSTYVSVGISASAKGVDIRDYMSLPSRTSNYDSKLLEPICPETKEASSMLLELDSLPAYKYHTTFLFYRPERGLLVTDKKQSIEEVAITLTLAMQQAQEGREAPHWSLTTASAVYWVLFLSPFLGLIERVKGDAKNAIRCLRHALNNSPNEMKDVALISLANIYYQAGFLNSALAVAGKALEISPNSVVAVHFTLANIFESLGDLKSATDFYHSTLALQSNFQVAKNRIKAIYCKS